MMTNKEKMLLMVLSDHKLQEKYRYRAEEYPSLYDALGSRNPVVVAIARIIDELDGSEDPTVKSKVYKTVLNYLNENYYG